jgi:hypothetical protein
MVIFLTAIFIVLSLLAVLDFVNSRYKNVIYFSLGILLFCIAAFRLPYIDRDYSNYIRNFNMNLVIGQSLVEPSFIIISGVVHKFLFGKPVFLFTIYAFLGVATKLIAIKKLSNHFFLSLVVYFSYSFILHEMTQIRAGVSLGFILLAIDPLYRRKAVSFFLFATLASFFHYSAILIYFLWFLKGDRINVTVYAGLVIGSYFIYLFTSLVLTDLVSFLPQGEVLEKASRYENETGRGLNVFNAWQLLRCALCFFFLYYIDLLQDSNKYAILFVKMYVFAAVTFVLLGTNPTIATRIGDLFSIIDIVLLPCLFSVFKPRAAGFISVVIIAFFYLALNLYHNKIIL